VTELIAYLIWQHDEYLRIELPRLQQCSYGSMKPTGPKTAPPWCQFRVSYFSLKVDLDLHMRKEELALLPAIAQLEREASASSGLASQIRMDAIGTQQHRRRPLRYPQGHTR
jgi:iron-sulfur cluster repair protein YtfE (RIC family)